MSQIMTGPPFLGASPDVPLAIRMSLKELFDEGLIQDVPGWDPRTFLRAVTIPVHQVLYSAQNPARVQPPAKREGWLTSDDTRGWGNYGSRNQG